MNKPYQIEAQRAVKQLEAMAGEGNPAETVWEKLMLGLSTRKYGQAIRQFSEAYGLEKSAVSEHFVEASRAKLKDMMERRLEKTEMVGWLRKGVGELIRQAGLQLMDLLMQEEVRELVGERSQRQAERLANRWGSEQGYCVVMGQKVPIQRPRVRTTEEKEVRLGSYEMFHRLCALLIDATPFEGQQMVAALGIAQDGRKTILGIRQGATENATVVS